MSRSFRVLLAVVLLCIIGSAAFVSYKVFFSNPSRTIPLLKGSGSSVIEAVQTLERMGIKARIEEEDSTLPRGTVIGQWPEAGVKLRADKTVILKVSRGTEKQVIPDVRSLTQKQAVQKIQDAGFVVGEIQKINHEQPAGVVIAQNPASPASVSPSREIGLLVSLGPAVASGVVVVPDLIERDEKTAEQLAKENGLRPRTEYVFDYSTQQGMVIYTSPAAGRRVSRGSAITLRVATWDSKLAPKRKNDAHTGEKSAGGAQVVVVEPGTDPEKGVVASVNEKNEKNEKNEQPSANNAKKAPAAETKKAEAPRKKVARIRYQAPPVKNQTIVIEIVDKNGERTLLNRKVNAGENIRLSAPYVDEAVVSIYLGGNFVWQDRYK